MKIVAADDKECKNDFIKVMDGDCVSRLGESKFCGRTIPPPFLSTTNRLCVKFFSDDSQNDEGFVAKYHTINKPITLGMLKEFLCFVMCLGVSSDDMDALCLSRGQKK